MSHTRTFACAAVMLACSRSVDSLPAPTTSAAASPAPAAAEQLDRIDGRSPVPLLPAMASHQKQSMRDHLAAVQEIVAALSVADFRGVETAAARIGFSAAMGQMCTHMGAGAPGFSERAIEFHHTADRIGAAAREQDAARVLMALGATLQACTSCHAVWKQQVVDEPTWQRLTASLSPPGPR
jgi:hypothetical protein